MGKERQYKHITSDLLDTDFEITVRKQLNHGKFISELESVWKNQEETLELKTIIIEIKNLIHGSNQIRYTRGENSKLEELSVENMQIETQRKAM